MTATESDTIRSHSEPQAIQEATPVPRNLKSGTVIACFIEEYSDEEPQLGRVAKELRSNSNVVELEWMIGAYSRPWKLWKEKDGQTWKEKIPFDCVLFPVELDINNKLSMETVKKLKLVYNNLNSQN